MADVTLDNLNIEVTANTGRATQNLRRLRESLEKISGAVDLKGISAMGSVLRSLSASLQGFNNATTAGANIAKVATGLKRLEGISAENIRNVAGAIREYGAALSTVPQTTIPTLPRMSAASGGTTADATAGGATATPGGEPDAVQQTTEAMEEYDETLRQTAADESNVRARAFDMNNALKRVEAVANLVTQAIEKLGAAARAAFDKFKTAIQPVTDKIRGMLPNIVGLGKATKSTGKSTQDFGKALKTNLWTVIKYTFGVRSLFVLFRRLRRAVKDAFDNLVQYSASANQAISAMSSSLGALKNSLAVAFTPIVEAIAPAIVYLLDLLTAAFNAIGRFMAALTGKGFAVQAVKVQKDYAASLGDTAGGANDAAKAVDNLADSLSVLGFDELNQLDADKTKDYGGGGGGGGGGNAGDGVDISEYFTTVSLGDAVSEFGRKIREAFLAHDWEGLGQVIADKMNELNQFIYDHINWEVVGGAITEVVNAVTTTFNSWVDNFDWDLLGHTIGAGFQTAFNTAYLFITGIDWKALGSGIATTVNGFMDEVDFKQIGRTIGAGLMIVWDYLNGFVHTIHWGQLGRSIADAITGFFEEYSFSDIADTIATFFNGLFQALWNFAITLDWFAIAQNIVDGINTFIEKFEWEANGQRLWTFIQKLLGALIKVVQETDWYGLAYGIGEMLNQVDWGAVLAGVAYTILHVLGELIKGLWDSGGVGKAIVAGIAIWFTATKLMPIANAISKAFTNQSIYSIIAKGVIVLFRKIFASKAMGEAVGEGMSSAIGSAGGSAVGKGVGDATGGAIGGATGGAITGGATAGGASALGLAAVGVAAAAATIWAGSEVTEASMASIEDSTQYVANSGIAFLDEALGVLGATSEESAGKVDRARKQIAKLTPVTEQGWYSADQIVKILEKEGIQYNALSNSVKYTGKSLDRFSGDTDNASTSLQNIGDKMIVFEAKTYGVNHAASEAKSTLANLNTQLENLHQSGTITDSQFFNLTDSIESMRQKGIPAQKILESISKTLLDAGITADVLNNKVEETTYHVEAGSHYVAEAIDKMAHDAAEAARTRAESISTSVGTMAESIRVAAQKSVASFGDFEVGAETTLGDLTGQLTSSIESFQNWEKNLTAIAEYGADGVHTAIDEGVLQELARLGPEGAAYVQMFADAVNAKDDEAIAAFNDAWRTKLDLEGGLDSAGSKLLSATATLAGKQYDASLEVGSNSSKGISDGFNTNKKEFIDSAYNLANEGHEAYALADQQHSPSAFWAMMGGNDVIGLANGMREKAGVLRTQITNLVLIAHSTLTKQSKRFKDFGGEMASTITSGLNSKKGLLGSAMDSILQTMYSKITGFVSRFRQAMDNLAGRMIDALRAKQTTFASTMQSIITAMQNKIVNSAGTFRQLGSQIGTYIASGIGTGGAVINAISNMISGVSGLYSSMYNAGVYLAGAFSKAFQDTHIPIPHLYIKGDKAMTQGNYSYLVPQWDVNWYARGGLFTNASMIGVGERGNEAVLPLEDARAMQNIASAILSGMDSASMNGSAMEAAVERGMVSALMRNTGNNQAPTFNVVVKTQNDEVLARAVTRGQKKLDYRFNPVAQY